MDQGRLPLGESHRERLLERERKHRRPRRRNVRTAAVDFTVMRLSQRIISFAHGHHHRDI